MAKPVKKIVRKPPVALTKKAAGQYLDEHPPEPPAAPAPPSADVTLGGEPVAPLPQLVTADDLHEIISQGEKDREGREKAELLVRELEEKNFALENKLKAQKPIRFDEQRVAASSNAVFMSALLNIRGAMRPLALASAPAARVLLQLDRVETELGITVTAATIVLQRAKVMAEHKLNGLEVTPEEIADLLEHARKLI
jgi:hypothetical protein